MRIPIQTWALTVARAVAEASEDPYCRVGAVILSADRIILATGYNGTPKGTHIDMADRDARRPFMIHAEANALRYVDPRHAEGGLLAVTHQPCEACVNLASAYSLATIVYAEPPANPERYLLEGPLRVAHMAGITLLQGGSVR